MRIWSRKIKAKKSHKNKFGEGLGPLLGGVWVVWGVSWVLLGASWLVFGRSKSSCFFNMGPRSAPRSLLDRSGIDFGRVWGGFGEGFGRIWELS